MSLWVQKLKGSQRAILSALPLKADMREPFRHVHFVPILLQKVLRIRARKIDSRLGADAQL